MAWPISSRPATVDATDVSAKPLSLRRRYGHTKMKGHPPPPPPPLLRCNAFIFVEKKRNKILNKRSKVERLGVCDFFFHSCQSFTSDSFSPFPSIFQSKSKVLWFFFFGSSWSSSSTSSSFFFFFQSVEELETEMLGGQKLQGPPTAQEVHKLLAEKGKIDA